MTRPCMCLFYGCRRSFSNYLCPRARQALSLLLMPPSKAEPDEVPIVAERFFDEMEIYPSAFAYLTNSSIFFCFVLFFGFKLLHLYPSYLLVIGAWRLSAALAVDPVTLCAGIVRPSLFLSGCPVVLLTSRAWFQRSQKTHVTSSSC